MFRGTFYKVTFLAILLFCLPEMVYPQEKVNPGIRIMFYNVENLFDIYNDSLKDDDEFLPDGIRRWNSSRYYKKLNSVFRAIAAAGEWSPPEIICFSEIENQTVLEDLITNTYLSKFNYGIIHSDSPDSRGIDVGLIYRKDIVEILQSTSLIPRGYSTEDFYSRSVLYTTCIIQTDTVDIFVNHWPSRIGGGLSNFDLRADIAETVKEKADSVFYTRNGKARTVILGDFNCSRTDSELRILTNAASERVNGAGSALINLSEKLEIEGHGTYRYQGMWEMLDHIIVSEYLINTAEGLSTSEEGFKIVKYDFLLRKDTKYPGLTPYSTFLGYRYQGGTSDHLPVIIHLQAK